MFQRIDYIDNRNKLVVTSWKREAMGDIIEFKGEIMN